MTYSDVGQFAIYAFAMGMASGITLGTVQRVFAFFNH